MSTVLVSDKEKGQLKVAVQEILDSLETICDLLGVEDGLSRSSGTPLWEEEEDEEEGTEEPPCPEAKVPPAPPSSPLPGPAPVLQRQVAIINDSWRDVTRVRGLEPISSERKRPRQSGPQVSEGSAMADV